MQVEEAVPPSLYDPINLIENVFLGDGVEVTSVVFNGNNNAVGYFKDGTAQVGMQRGIVMSSGFAGSADNPNDSPNTSGMTSGSSINDPDLAALTTVPIRDVARYEIKFIPISDTLRFKYAFASEEYPEFTCTSFNDVFGFFISGPNPAGGTYNSKNIALVPDPADPSGLTFTNISVAINNVHNGNPGNPSCIPSFPEYYNTNPTGTDFLTYDAILDVFIAQAIVIPCEEYTIKLAIADGSDQIYDSAVFLEAKSFGTGSLEVSTETVSLDGSIAEGCDGGKIIFSLPNPVEEDYVVDANIITDPSVGKLAENGIDFTQIDFPIIIPKDSSKVVIEVIAFEDGIDDDEELIAIDIQKDVCNRDTLYILVRENKLISPILPPDVTICAGEEFFIDTELDPNFFLPPPPTFYNSTDITISPENTAIFSNIEVIGVAPDILGPGVIKKVCIDTLIHRYLNDIDLFLISPGGQFLELSTDNGFKPLNGQDIDTMINTCFTVSASNSVNNGNGLIGDIDPANPTYTGDYAPEGVWSDLWDGEFPSNGTWQLMIIDDETGFVGQLRGWNMCFNSIYDISYEWGPDDGSIDCIDCPDVTVNPDTTTTYFLTTYDTYGCSVVDSVTVYVSDNQVMVSILDESATSCFNTTDGWVQLDAQGDFPPFTYEYENLMNQTGLFEDLGVGIHTIFITDAEGCMVSYDVEIDSPDEITAIPASGSGILCSGDNTGVAAFEVMGGVGPYSFVWSNGVMDSVNVNLVSGSYDVSITDVNGCNITATYLFTEPDALELTMSALHLSCFQDGSGIASVMVSGGNEPYSYAWDDPMNQNLESAINLEAGIYTVTVTDANDCSETGQVELFEPEELVTQMNGVNESCSGSGNGTAEVNAQGGGVNYFYLWSNGQSGTNVISDLSPGWYSVTVSDENGCSAVDSLQIGTSNAINMTAVITDANCFGDMNGSVQVSPSGGTGLIDAIWNNGSTSLINANLSAGIYCVTLTDENNCLADSCFEVLEPEIIQVTLTSTDLNCYATAEGSINTEISGGVGPYMINWSGPGGFNSSDEDINNLFSGQYDITITDANDCVMTASQTLTEPDSIYVEIFIKDVQCFGENTGSIAVTIIGGNEPYTYKWTGPSGYSSSSEDISDLFVGTYNLTITDGNGCSQSSSYMVGQPVAPLLANVSDPDTICNNALKGKVSTSPSGGVPPYTIAWSTGDPFPLINDLPGGAYIVTITDVQDCEVIDTAYIVELDVINVQLAGTASLCTGSFDGSAEVIQVSYGNQTAPLDEFEYIWNSAPLQFDPVAVNLKGGETYQVVVTDKFGCTGTAEIVIENPSPVTSQIVEIIEVSCFEGDDGSITIQGQGGQGPYTYAWGPGTNFQTGPTASGLQDGEYFVTVSDANGCTGTKSFILNEPPEIEFDFRVFDVYCFDGDNGELKVIANGGTPEYTYIWSNGGTSNEIVNLSSASYTVTLTDARGCTFIDSAFVGQPATPLDLEASGIDVSCFGGQDGSIEFQGSGGNGFYLYSVDGIHFTGAEQQVGLTAGVYTVYVKDLKGCIDSIQNIVVNEPPPIMVDLGEDIIVTLGQNIVLDPQIFNAQGLVSYDWNSVNIDNFTCDDCPNPTITVLDQMTVELIIQDENFCVDKDYLNILIENYNAVFVPTGFSPNNDGNNDILNVFGIEGVKIRSFRIFDRWGELLYEAEDFDVNNLEIGWDGNFKGKEMDPGVFIWTIEAEFVNGHKEDYKGHFTLIR